MRIVLQRVHRAAVVADGVEVGAIGRGLVALVGVGQASTDDDARWLARKTADLRIFPSDDEEPGATNRMDRSVADIGGGVLAISQFTLYASTRKGRRPSFLDAAEPDVADAVYEEYCRALPVTVARGVFGAQMTIEMVADGPVTLCLTREQGT